MLGKLCKTVQRLIIVVAVIIMKGWNAFTSDDGIILWMFVAGWEGKGSHQVSWDILFYSCTSCELSLYSVSPFRAVSRSRAVLVGSRRPIHRSYTLGEKAANNFQVTLEQRYT